MSVLSRIKAMFNRDQYIASSIRAFDGSGRFGEAPWPWDYRRAVYACNSWVYRCVLGNAHAFASAPLRLYSRKLTRSQMKARGITASAWQTRPVSVATKRWLRGEYQDHRPSDVVRAKIFELGDDYEEVSMMHPVLELLRNVNPQLNGFNFAAWRAAQVQLIGNAYVHPVMSEELNRPVELWPMPGHWVHVIPGSVDSGRMIDGYVYGQTTTEERRFEPDEVLHWKSPAVRGHYYGEGPLEAAWHAVGANASQKVYQKALFDNHARIDFILSSEGASSPQLDALEANVNNLYRGARNAGKFMAVNSKVAVTPLQWSPDVLGTTEAIIEEIAGVFGYPLTKLKSNDPNRANAETGDAGWLKDTILPMLVADEQALNQDGYLGLFGDGALLDDAVLAYDDPVPKNQAASLERGTRMVNGALLLVNEFRAEEGLPPVDGGDVPRFNGVPLDAMGQQPASPFAGLPMFSTPPATRDDVSGMGRDLDRTIRDVLAASARTVDQATIDAVRKAIAEEVEADFARSKAETADAVRRAIVQIADARRVDVTMAADTKNCGIGEDGFQTGNDCAGGGGGGGSNRLQSATRDGDKVVLADGTDAPENIQKLAIPPAWTDLEVNPDPNGSMLAKGRDAKGRVQSIYSDGHNEKQAAAKFARVREMSEDAPKIDAKIRADVASGSEPAAVMSVIRDTGIRPGSTRDTGGDVRAFGATTLKAEHVKVGPGGDVRLQFVGKKGVDLDIAVSDPSVASMLKNRATSAGPGGNLFSADDSDLRDYARTIGRGGYKPKDFRTMKANEISAAAIRDMPPPETMKGYKSSVREVAKRVSAQLGNTPTVALKSYIDPSVFSSWRPSDA